MTLRPSSDRRGSYSREHHVEHFPEDRVSSDRSLVHLADESQQTRPALHSDRAQRPLDGAENLQLVMRQTPTFAFATEEGGE